MPNIRAISDDAECYEVVRPLRWPDGVRCPHCDSGHAIEQGHDPTRPARRHYRCRGCGRRLDDLTGTIFAGHHQPLRVRARVLYFMGLNRAGERIARELDRNPDDAQRMASRLREGIARREPEVVLAGEVECDGVYVVAGHEGHPEAVRRRGAPGAADG